MITLPLPSSLRLEVPGDPGSPGAAPLPASNDEADVRVRGLLLLRVPALKVLPLTTLPDCSLLE